MDIHTQQQTNTLELENQILRKLLNQLIDKTIESTVDATLHIKPSEFKTEINSVLSILKTPGASKESGGVIWNPTDGFHIDRVPTDIDRVPTTYFSIFFSSKTSKNIRENLIKSTQVCSTQIRFKYTLFSRKYLCFSSKFNDF